MIPQLLFFVTPKEMGMSPVRLLLITGFLVAALVLCAGCTQSAPVVKTESATGTSTPVPAVTTAAALPPSTTATPAASDLSGKKVRLETTMGNITIALDPNMPITAGNFETLVLNGYYDGVIFHRIIDGFMIQGGDPTGTGRGGPGYTINDEFTTTNKNNRGTVAMANSGPNTAGSQFFINTVDNNYLDSKHPVFGTVIEGMDVVDVMAKVQTSGKPYYRPVQNVTIIRAAMV
jgi:peptidylprolyl isomerase